MLEETTIEKIQLGKNTGFIAEVWPTDYHAALGAADEPVFRGLDMRTFRSAPQWQSGKNGDKQCCVSQARTESEEEWLNFMYKTGVMPQKSVLFLQKNGYFVDDKIELNVRALAQWSDTTENGNSIPKVCTVAHQKGFGPHNYSGYADDASLTWQEYYVNPPKAFEDLAKEYREQHFFDKFSWVITGAQKHTVQDKLQMAQAAESGILMVASATCSPWADKTPPACSLFESTHSYLIDRVVPGQALYARDHYSIFDKELPYDYIVPWVMKIVVKCIAQDDGAPVVVVPPEGVGKLMKVIGISSVYMYMLDGNWHGLDDMDIHNDFKGPYDPTSVLRLKTLPKNVSYTIMKKPTDLVKVGSLLIQIIKIFIPNKK